MLIANPRAVLIEAISSGFDNQSAALIIMAADDLERRSEEITGGPDGQWLGP
jgi:hypothetical protein